MSSRKSMLSTICLIIVLPVAVWANTKTVTLNVPGMTCPTCPITIKKALNKVQGVSKVEVKYEKKQAVVTFDDTNTDIKSLVKATTDAGYPSQPDGERK